MPQMRDNENWVELLDLSQRDATTRTDLHVKHCPPCHTLRWDQSSTVYSEHILCRTERMTFYYDCDTTIAMATTFLHSSGMMSQAAVGPASINTERESSQHPIWQSGSVDSLATAKKEFTTWRSFGNQDDHINDNYILRFGKFWLAEREHTFFHQKKSCTLAGIDYKFGVHEPPNRCSKFLQDAFNIHV